MEQKDYLSLEVEFNLINRKEKLDKNQREKAFNFIDNVIRKTYDFPEENLIPFKACADEVQKLEGREDLIKVKSTITFKKKKVKDNLNKLKNKIEEFSVHQIGKVNVDSSLFINSFNLNN